ncbi:MAG: hypothetical protein P4L83_12725 [Nevskia sp.]|nr:hypothetical protein [Nevskia sp.]
MIFTSPQQRRLANRRLAPGLISAAVLALSACGGNNSTPPGAGNVALANGTSDSNGMTAAVSNIPTVGPISFDSASGLNVVPEGSYKVQLTTGNGSGGSQTFTVNNVSIDHNNTTTVFSYGTVAGKTINGFPAEISVNAPANGQFTVQTVHAAYAGSLVSPSINFYFVKPGAGISGTPAAVSFGTSPPSFALPSGTYEIIVTADLVKVYDSGPKGVILPPNNTNVVQIAALDAPGAPNGSPISLLMLDNDGGNTPLLNGAH